MSVPNNLPTHLTSFVGRERELAELDGLLDDTRLLMLTGAGGCGKSRLASRLGHDVLHRYPDGVWWLDLAPISEPALVESALASAVGVRPLPGRTPLDAAIAHLTAKRALVVVDNCEHVLAPSRRLVAGLLQGCPDVAVVATSREPLGLGGETTWRVPSLSLPGREEVDAVGVPILVSPEDADAVRLFVERASRVLPEFALTDANASLVSRICEQLDGIPLAVELAAVRVRVLSLDRIERELADRFRLLTGGDPGGVPRLRTLRASVDWSFELLDTSERALLRRCAVFSGGFTLELCEAVCAGDLVERGAVLDLVTSLVDKSLLLVADRESSRFGMLETIRQYALERLVEAGELDATLARHAAAVLAFTERAAPTLGGEVEPGDTLLAEAANLYAAIEHLARIDPGRSLRLCNVVSYWWLLTGRLTEGPAALTRSIDAARDLHSPDHAAALFWRGYLAFFAGDYERTEIDEQQALALSRRLGDATTEARALSTLGLLRSQSNPQDALTRLEQARGLAEVASDAWCLSEAIQNIGWALVQMGHYHDAEVAFEESRSIAERNGWRELVVWHWVLLGHAVLPSGDLEGARQMWVRGMESATPVQEGFALWSLSLLDVDAGDASEALERLERGRPRMVAEGAGLGVQHIDSGIGLALAALGDLQDARAVLDAAAAEHSGAFRWTEAITRCDLAHVEHLLGDDASAQRSAEAALGIAEGLGHAGLTARARNQLAAIAAARSDFTLAEQLTQRALGDQLHSRTLIDVPVSFELLAEVEQGFGRQREAARLLAAASRIRTDMRRARWQPDEQHVQDVFAQLEASLGATEFEEARAEGEAMAFDDVVELVRRARGSRRRPTHGWASLTPTELAVVRHVASGLTNPEIAARMFVSRGTVKTHLSHVYDKVGLRNRSEIAAEAIRRNLLEHD